MPGTRLPPPIFGFALILAGLAAGPTARAEAPRDLAGHWLAEDIGGEGVIDNAQSVLELRADGGVGGSGGCNTMTGRADLGPGTLRFGPIATTRMACVPALMTQEARFFEALADTTAYRLDGSLLYLLSESGEELARLVRTD